MCLAEHVKHELGLLTITFDLEEELDDADEDGSLGRDLVHAVGVSGEHGLELAVLVELSKSLVEVVIEDGHAADDVSEVVLNVSIYYDIPRVAAYLGGGSVDDGYEGKGGGSEVCNIDLRGNAYISLELLLNIHN